MRSAALRTHDGPRVSVEVPSTGEATRFLSELLQLVLVGGHGLDPSRPEAVQFRLAAVEAITNVHRHAYPEGAHGTITLDVRRDGPNLVAVLRDRGAPFDPKTSGTGRMPGPEELAEGGYGLAILAQTLDDLRYRRDGDTNELTLVKRMWE